MPRPSIIDYNAVSNSGCFKNLTTAATSTASSLSALYMMQKRHCRYKSRRHQWAGGLQHRMLHPKGSSLILRTTGLLYWRIYINRIPCWCLHHVWELPDNYRDFIGVMVFYLFCWRTKRICSIPCIFDTVRGSSLAVNYRTTDVRETPDRPGTP